MSSWPTAAAWREACAEDAVLAAWRGPWSVDFAVDSDGAATTFAFVDGRLTGGAVLRFVGAPGSTWAKFLAPVPPCHHNAIFAMLARVSEFAVRGDRSSVSSSTAMWSAGCWRSAGGWHSATRSRHLLRCVAPLGSATPAPVVTGGYSR